MWFKQALLLVASLLVGVLLLELMLRVLGWSFPVFAQPDANLGWSFRPGVGGWSVHENTVPVRMNRYGFRGADWSEQPAPNTYRVAVLGDSFVDSSNLVDEAALTTIIEKHLGACPALAKRRVEVLNFGVSGYGTAQQFLTLQQRVASFRPDLVLLAFYAGNDVPNNSRALSADDQKARPYYLEQPSGELRLDMSFRDSNAFRQATERDWQRRLLNWSYVLQALKQAYIGKSIMPVPVETKGSAQGQQQDLFRPEFPKLFAAPADDTWRSAWSVTEKILVLMRDWTAQQKMAFDLVIIPDPMQAVPGNEWRQALAKAIGSTEPDYPVTRIAQFAEQNGIATLSLLEPFRAYADRESAFLYGFPPKLGNGHLNATGNEVGGTLIADWLCRQSAP